MTLIEKLEKLSDEYFNLYTAYGDRADLNCSGAVDEAINIVKEHKCIWKGVYNDYYDWTNYTLSCGNEYFDSHMEDYVKTFKYCHFCGGEVEFSGVKL